MKVLWTRRAPMGRRRTVAVALAALSVSPLIDVVQPVSVHAAGASDPTGDYVALNPAIIADTSAGGAAPLAPNQKHGFQVLGTGGVPATGVSAVVVSVFYFYQSDVAVARVWDFDRPKPTSTATTYWQPNQWHAVQATVPVGSSGKIALEHTAGTAHLTIQVQGYYSSVTGTLGSRYRGIAPARIVDTREGLGAIKGCAFPNHANEYQVKGVGGVPATATAVMVNVTAIGCNGPTTTKVHAADVAAPTANVPNHLLNTEQWRAAAVAVRLPQGGAKDGRIAVTVGGNYAHVLIDVVGYYHQDKTTEAGRFVPLDPTRLYDSATTPQGAFAPNSTRTLTVAGQPGLPAFGVSSVSLNVHAVWVPAGGFLTVYPGNTAPPNPLTSSLNYYPGAFWTNAVTTKVQDSPVASQDGSFSIYSWAGTHVAVDANGYFTR